MKKTFTIIITTLCAISSWAYDVQIGGIYYNLNKTEMTAEVTHGATSIYYEGDISVPEAITCEGQQYAITALGDSAFWYCRNMTSLVMPNSVKRIGDYCCTGCGKMTAVSMSNAIDSIGAYAFAGDTELTSIDLPETLQKVKEMAFFRCTGIERFIIPDAVKTIETYAFSECSGAKEIKICNNLETLGSSAFADCTSLTKIEVPASLKRIEYYTFEGCTSLKEITLNEGLEYIGERAFCNTAVENLTIPESVNNIAFGFVRGVKTLQSITCLSANLPNVDEDMFYGCDLTNCTLYVPAESIDKYKSTAPWNKCKTICAIGTGIDAVTISQSISNVVYRINNHISIVNINGKNIKIIER